MTEYKMYDLYYGNNQIIPKYYAFVSTGVTLHCYQTADVGSWSDVFQEKSTEISYPKLGELKQGFDKTTLCSDSSASLIYFDESSDSASWSTDVKEAEAIYDEPGCPTLNGVTFSGNGTSSWETAYGGWSSTILSHFCGAAFSTVAASGTAGDAYQ